MESVVKDREPCATYAGRMMVLLSVWEQGPFVLVCDRENNKLQITQLNAAVAGNLFDCQKSLKRTPQNKCTKISLPQHSKYFSKRFNIHNSVYIQKGTKHKLFGTLYDDDGRQDNRQTCVVEWESTRCNFCRFNSSQGNMCFLQQNEL